MREEAQRFSKQQQEEYLESDEYNKLQGESFQKSCESAKKDKLENPNVFFSQLDVNNYYK